ncbi:MAG: hypothetical protein Kow0059_00760 [Candidatus Sumerlaeia bacterium]
MNDSPRHSTIRWLLSGAALAGGLMLLSAFTLPVQEGEPAAQSPEAKEVSQYQGAFLTEEEMNAAVQILKNRQRIERILGPGQIFLYDPTKLAKPFRDPMIIPWTRYNKDLPQILRRIENLMQEGKLDQARAELVNIKTNFPDNPYMQRIEEMIYQIDHHNPDATPTPTPTPRFPVKILDDTRGILYSPEEPLVIIGEDVLRVGDTVRQNEEVTVKRIEPSRVVFEYKGIEYEKVIDALEE